MFIAERSVKGVVQTKLANTLMELYRKCKGTVTREDETVEGYYLVFGMGDVEDNYFCRAASDEKHAYNEFEDNVLYTHFIVNGWKITKTNETL